VRCIFAVLPPETSPQIYEERITLWRADSFDEAIAMAEEEARRYAEDDREQPFTYLGLAQAYRAYEGPRHGAEVFSLMRESDHEPDDYLDTFFDTGQERQSAETDELTR
jgi:hypothetical protein